MIRIIAITFAYADGRRNKVHFDDVPFYTDNLEELRKRLPTDAKLYFDYIEDDYERNIHSNCANSHLNQVEE